MHFVPLPSGLLDSCLAPDFAPNPAPDFAPKPAQYGTLTFRENDANSLPCPSFLDNLERSFAHFESPEAKSISSVQASIPHTPPLLPSPGASTTLEMEILSPETRRLALDCKKDNNFNTLSSIEEILDGDRDLESNESNNTEISTTTSTTINWKSCFRHGKRLDPDTAKVQFLLLPQISLFRKMLVSSWDSCAQHFETLRDRINARQLQIRDKKS